MDNEIKAMFNAILEEIGRMEERINRRMDECFSRIEEELETLHHEVNACKLERESIGLLIKKMINWKDGSRNWKREPHNGIHTM